jgi:mannosyltransferase
VSSAVAVPERVALRDRLAALGRLRAVAAGRLPGRVLEALALLVLVAIAARLRRHALGAPFWIDEGISVGIASHPLSAIPGLLRQDGSPPLYYLLLHEWIAAFGDSERATHAFSALAAVLCVPAAWWAARPFGRSAAAVAGAVLAVNPYVGLYADETRMYSLVLLLTLLATGAFLRAFVLGRRPYVPVFAVLLAAVLYTHNWGVFFAVAAGVAWLALLAIGPGRRRLALDGVLAFGGALVLFAPWLPTLAYQAAHTGAPWSHRPTGHSIVRALSRVLGGHLPETVLLLIAGGGLVELLRRGPSFARRGALATLVVAAGTLLAAWAWSRLHSPAWALRYMVIVLAPLVVIMAAGLGRLPVLAAGAVVIVFLLAWRAHPSPQSLETKSDVAPVAQAIAPALPRGTLVFSSQPEQVPNLAYYLPPGLRYLTPLGPVRDTGVMDWRDAMRRLDAARFDRVLGPAVRRMRPGERLLLIQPLFGHPDAPWTREIRRIERRWRRALSHQGLVRELQAVRPRHGDSRSTVAGILLERTVARVGSHHTAIR